MNHGEHGVHGEELNGHKFPSSDVGMRSMAHGEGFILIRPILFWYFSVICVSSVVHDLLAMQIQRAYW